MRGDIAEKLNRELQKPIRNERFGQNVSRFLKSAAGFLLATSRAIA
jgi:hypothetical protein